jgi:hypothetical protein
MRMEQNQFNPDPPTPPPPTPPPPQPHWESSSSPHAPHEPLQPWPPAPIPSPPPTAPGQLGATGNQWQTQIDLHHLKLLAVFYYICAGLQAIGGCFSLFYVVLGIGIANAPPPQTSSGRNLAEAPEFIGGMFIFIGGCLGLLFIVWTVLCIMTGISLTTQKRRTLCLVTAGLMCLNIPLGTVLGVFTFVVLSRPNVIAMFQRNRMMPG